MNLQNILAFSSFSDPCNSFIWDLKCFGKLNQVHHTQETLSIIHKQQTALVLPYGDGIFCFLLLAHGQLAEVRHRLN